jgi:hypothetical protein
MCDGEDGAEEDTDAANNYVSDAHERVLTAHDSRGGDDDRFGAAEERDGEV